MQFYFNGEEFDLNVGDRTNDEYVEYLAMLLASKGKSLEIEEGLFLYYTPEGDFQVTTGCGDPITDEYASATHALDDFYSWKKAQV